MNPVQIEWRNLLYNVEVEDKEAPHSRNPFAKKPMKQRTILNDLSGFVSPGSMLAIMGPSGSGKTTLLNVLAGRINRKLFQGNVLINNQPADRSILKVVAGYVPQDDILYGSQTVYEAFMFYAHLKLPHLTQEEKERRVRSLVDELGLQKVCDSYIGFVGAEAASSGLQRGISGGERKRTSIGCQLIADPALLFLDEPTTGLDSFAAEAIIRVLARQLQIGRTVIFTIHQPSTDVLKLFDQLMIIAYGNTVYFGPQSSALKYFASVGYPCPSDENPGDHFVEIIHREKTRKVNIEDYDSEEEIESVEAPLKRNFFEETAEGPPVPGYVPRPPSKKELSGRKYKKELSKSNSAFLSDENRTGKFKQWEENNDDKGKDSDEKKSNGHSEPKNGKNGKNGKNRKKNGENGTNGKSERSKSESESESESEKGEEGKPILGEERALKLANKFTKSKYAKIVPPPVPENTTLPTLRRAGPAIQFRELIKRSVVQITRDPRAAKAGVIQSLFISLVMGVIYYNLGFDQEGIQDRAGALFFGAIFLMFGGMMTPLALFSVERKQFLFQYMEALFTPGIYYLSKILPESVPVLVNTTLFSVIFYFMLDLRRTANYFFIFWIIAYELVMCAQAFSFFLASVISDFGILMTLFPIFFFPQMIFSGFYLNSASTPVYFIWVEYLSLIKYAFQALCINEFQGEAFYCSESDLVANDGICPYTVGDQWLTFRDLNNFTIYGCALVLLLFIVAYHVGGFYFTRRTAILSTK